MSRKEKITIAVLLIALIGGVIAWHETHLPVEDDSTPITFQ